MSVDHDLDRLLADTVSRVSEALRASRARTSRVRRALAVRVIDEVTDGMLPELRHGFAQELEPLLVEALGARSTGRPPTRSRPPVRRADPRRADPRRAEPRESEPVRSERRPAGPGLSDPFADPDRAEPDRAEPDRGEPDRAEPLRGDPDPVEVQDSEVRSVRQQGSAIRPYMTDAPSAHAIEPLAALLAKNQRGSEDLAGQIARDPVRVEQMARLAAIALTMIRRLDKVGLLDSAPIEAVLLGEDQRDQADDACLEAEEQLKQSVRLLGCVDVEIAGFMRDFGPEALMEKAMKSANRGVLPGAKAANAWGHLQKIVLDLTTEDLADKFHKRIMNRIGEGKTRVADRRGKRPPKPPTPGPSA